MKSHRIDASLNTSERKTNYGLAKRESAGQESAEKKENKKEAEKPRRTEPDFFEEGVEPRENDLNVKVLKAAPRRDHQGVYLQEREGSQGIDAEVRGNESETSPLVAIVEKAQRATPRVAAMIYGVEPREFSFPVTKRQRTGREAKKSTNTEKVGFGRSQEGWSWS